VRRKPKVSIFVLLQNEYEQEGHSSKSIQ